MGSVDVEAPSGRIRAAMTNIRVDAATAEVMRALERAGAPAILLKGPALADWEADRYARAYADCDLWVAPPSIDKAQRTLGELGFKPAVDDRGLPAWWQEHASDWTRELDGVAVDLHQVLQGVGAAPEQAWEVLFSDTDGVVVAGYRARRLSAAGRALYVALHAAHHGEQADPSLLRLDAALAAADERVWRDACALASQLDALDAFATGLRLTAAGADLAARLSLPPTRSVTAALRATTPPPVALGFDQLATGGLAGPKILVRKVVPPPGFIRHWWPPAGSSRRMLAVGYIYRPIWLVRNAPRGWRAWRAARRQVMNGGRGSAR